MDARIHSLARRARIVGMSHQELFFLAVIFLSHNAIPWLWEIGRPAHDPANPLVCWRNDITGPIADFIPPLQNAANLAVKEVNNNGGLLDDEAEQKSRRQRAKQAASVSGQSVRESWGRFVQICWETGRL
jgi:hypothetical protein